MRFSSILKKNLTLILAEKLSFRSVPAELLSGRKVAVFKTSHLGDLLVTVPFISWLVQRENRIILYCNRNIHPLFDSRMIRWVPVESMVGHSGNLTPISVSVIGRNLVKALMQERVDISFNLFPDSFSIPAGFLKSRVHLADAWVRRKRKKMMASGFRGERLYSLFKRGDRSLLGFFYEPLVPFMLVRNAPMPSPAELCNLASRLVKKRKKIRKTAVLAPYSPWKYRCWSEDNFLEVGRFLKKKGYSVAVVGSRRERDMCGGRISWSSAGFRDLTGSPLSLALSICLEAEVFVGNDGGLAHASALSGAKTVVIFGPQSPSRFAPVGECVRTAYFPVSCSPCSQVRCENLVNGRPLCLESVKKEAVLEMLEEVL